jgi:hypothetical protein
VAKKNVPKMSVARVPVRRSVADTKEEVMRYMLLICGDESVVPTNEESEDMRTSAISWVEEMDGRGVRLQGSRLRPVSEATTVRVRDEKLMVSDGPFAETKEQMGGYDLIECKDLDEAIEVASKHPVARFGSVEIRPFWDE